MLTDDKLPKSLSDGAKKGVAGSSLNVIDEEQLNSFWQRGREAWAGVANATEWVERLRGSNVFAEKLKEVKSYDRIDGYSSTS